ncbi:MAG: hypothetical protein ACTSUE_18780, partial [Promethearchaeota archaeon]
MFFTPIDTESSAVRVEGVGYEFDTKNIVYKSKTGKLLPMFLNSVSKGDLKGLTKNEKAKLQKEFDDLYETLEKDENVKLLLDLYLPNTYDEGVLELDIESFVKSEAVKSYFGEGGMYKFLLRVKFDKRFSELINNPQQTNDLV